MESEDNSEETLELLRRWNIPANPPENDSKAIDQERRKRRRADVSSEEEVSAAAR
ncbi:BnaC03g75760D [Brassica napus]|uniref:BnaC03g75760D protein n=1 Tax=Brassica napus TaxID=3708 RepID=A0A078JH04_BRANA|nr:BnaC03g75760D [Brassica napus]